MQRAGRHLDFPSWIPLVKQMPPDETEVTERPTVLSLFGHNQTLRFALAFCLGLRPLAVEHQTLTQLHKMRVPPAQPSAKFK